MAQTKSANFFFFQIKSSEKQKCVNKLFLSKYKILKAWNKESQKFAILSPGIIFTEKLFFYGS